MARKFKKKSGLTQEILGNILLASNFMTELEDYRLKFCWQE